MTSAIQPYRQNARSIQVKEASKPLYGLIRLPRPEVHRCAYPGFLWRFFMGLTFRPVRSGSLYRCRECKDVWRLNRRNNDVWVLTWDRIGDYDHPEKRWLERGGAVEDKLESET